ncbi:MAG: hypothetical protein Q4G09_02120 [Clostridia bacterium]|nr:hypothetical protein [Clostridia bacterium]
MNKSKGITLIVLIITIIVMLILVGVSIAVAINGGLIGTAQDAAIKSKQKEAEKQIQTLLTYYKEQEYSGDLGDYLEDNLGENVVTYNVEDGTYTIIIGETETIVDENGDIVARPGLKIGDYVNYVPTAPINTAVTALNTEVNTYSGYTTTQTISQAPNLKWQILNIYPDGTVDLVSTPTGDVYFQGAQGYNNGVYLMHDICKVLYSNSTLGVEARSINLKDIEAHMTPAGKVAKNGYSGYGNLKTYTIANSYYPNIYAQENKSGINIDKEPEATIKERLKTNGIDASNSAQLDASTGNNARKQANIKGLTTTQIYYYITIDATKYGEAKTTLENLNDGYWLATRYVTNTSEYARYGLCFVYSHIAGNNMFYSDDRSDSNNHGLRAVVSLGPNIQIDKCTGTNGENNPHTIPALAE